MADSDFLMCICDVVMRMCVYRSNDDQRAKLFGRLTFHCVCVCVCVCVCIVRNK